MTALRRTPTLYAVEFSMAAVCKKKNRMNLLSGKREKQDNVSNSFVLFLESISVQSNYVKVKTCR